MFLFRTFALLLAYLSSSSYPHAIDLFAFEMHLNMHIRNGSTFYIYLKIGITCFVLIENESPIIINVYWFSSQRFFSLDYYYTLFFFALEPYMIPKSLSRVAFSIHRNFQSSEPFPKLFHRTHEYRNCFFISFCFCLAIFGVVQPSQIKSELQMEVDTELWQLLIYQLLF